MDLSYVESNKHFNDTYLNLVFSFLKFKSDKT